MTQKGIHLRENSSGNHFLCVAALCSWYRWSTVIVAIHHFSTCLSARVTFITPPPHLPHHIPSRFTPAPPLLPPVQIRGHRKSHNLSGKQKITVIERQRQQVSNLPFASEWHADPCLTSPRHFKLLGDLRNRNGVRPLLRCHGLTWNVDRQAR